MNNKEHYSSLPTLSQWEREQFRFTGFSDGGLMKEWKIVPFYRTRDSKIFDIVNFVEFCRALGCEVTGEGSQVTINECDGVHIFRANHWLCGWSEVIAVSPAHADTTGEIVAGFADYPAITDESPLEYELLQEVAEGYFKCLDTGDFKELYEKNGKVWDGDIEYTDEWSYEGSPQFVRDYCFDKVRERGE